MPPDKRKNNIASMPSAEEIERIRAARAAKKLVPKAAEPVLPLHPRAMLPLPAGKKPIGPKSVAFTVLTYNMLAQCLVRRELYPFAPHAALRQKYRTDRIIRELEERSPSLIAMQEVDNYDAVFAPTLAPVYDAVYALKNKINGGDAPNGHAPGTEGTDGGEAAKTGTEDAGGHGLLIAWKREMWSRVDYRELKFDGHPLTHPTPVRPKTGNIAQMVALRSSSSPGFGVILGNVHAYWRPTAKFERARQIYVLLRELMEFRRSLDKCISWTTMLCGDFNTVPSSVAYRVLTRSVDFSVPELRAEALQELEPHISAYGTLGVDEPTVEDAAPYPPNPLPPEMLLSLLESLPLRLESVYAKYMDLDSRHTRDPRWAEDEGWTGEPVYTTSCMFAGTLDYIFILRDEKRTDGGREKEFEVNPVAVLEVPPVEVVLTGIPNDVFPSDHIPLMAELVAEGQ